MKAYFTRRRIFFSILTIFLSFLGRFIADIIVEECDEEFYKKIKDDMNTIILLIGLAILIFLLIKWRVQDKRQYLIQKIFNLENDLISHRNISAISNYYKNMKNYTGDGQTVKYYNKEMRNKIFWDKQFKECKYVFDTLQNNNPSMTPETLHNLLAQYYNIAIEDIKKATQHKTEY